MRETLPRPTDLPHAQRRQPQAIATLTTIEESIMNLSSCCREPGRVAVRFSIGRGPAGVTVVMEIGFFTPCMAGFPRCVVPQRAKKGGVHNVHTLGSGFSCSGVGLGRIGEVFESGADFQGERLVRVPPRARVSAGQRLFSL